MKYLLFRIRLGLCNERGAGVVELAVIIVILVALALLFKDGITAVLEEIISKISSKVASID